MMLQWAKQTAHHQQKAFVEDRTTMELCRTALEDARPHSTEAENNRLLGLLLERCKDTFVVLEANLPEESAAHARTEPLSPQPFTCEALSHTEDGYRTRGKQISFVALLDDGLDTSSMDDSHSTDSDMDWSVLGEWSVPSTGLVAECGTPQTSHNEEASSPMSAAVNMEDQYPESPLPSLCLSVSSACLSPSCSNTQGSDEEGDLYMTEATLPRESASHYRSSPRTPQQFSCDPISTDGYNCLENGDWLGDEIINHSQMLLRSQFPEIDGLQHTRVFQAAATGGLIGTPERPFVQILHVNSGHWLCVSTIGCQPGTVHIYDSMTPYSSPQLQKSIAWMVYHNGSHIKLVWKPFQRQKGAADCGLFAVAAAVALCSGQDPSHIQWMQGQMREHLARSLHQDSMSTFPTGRRVNRSMKSLKEELVPIYCVCRQPYYDNKTDLVEENMAQCSTCEEWYHSTCGQVPSAAFDCDSAKYTCKFCAM